MTKTKRTTCGARCEAKVVHGVTLKIHMIALPATDLTKLREAFAKLPTDEDVIDLYTNEQIMGFFLDIKALVQAVKELLEQEENNG